MRNQRTWLCVARKLEWVIYAKPPFGAPEHALKYLARYTHRVAIANGRLISLDAGTVRFHWRHSHHGNQIKETTLHAVEFIRRFLFHVLPSGFVKSGILDSSPTEIASRAFCFAVLYYRNTSRRNPPNDRWSHGTALCVRSASCAS